MNKIDRMGGRGVQKSFSRKLPKPESAVKFCEFYHLTFVCYFYMVFFQKMAEARDRALNEIATLKEDFIETLDSLEMIEDRKDIVSRAMKDLSKVCILKTY